MLPSGESWVMRGRHSQSLHTRRAACGHIDRTAPPPSPCGKGRSLPPSPSCTLCAFSFLAACCCAALLVVAGVPPTLLSSPAPTLGLLLCSTSWWFLVFLPPSYPQSPAPALGLCWSTVFPGIPPPGLGLPVVPGYIYFSLVPPIR